MKQILQSNTGFTYQTNLEDLQLHSIGILRKYMFIIYGIGLYLSNSIEKNVKSIINSKDKKCLLLKFYRPITNKQILESFSNDFTLRGCSKLMIKQLNKIMLQLGNLQYHDTIKFLSINESTKIIISKNDTIIDEVLDPESLVTKYLFLCYLDDNTITKDLITNMI